MDYLGKRIEAYSASSGVIAMIEHGITTTKADVCLHFHPLESRVYSYRVRDMRIFLTDCNSIDGRSKDGEITSRGILVHKWSHFIRIYSVSVPVLNWQQMTDREAGMRAERIILGLLNQAAIMPSADRPFRLVNNLNDQFNGIDVTNGKIGVQIKCERICSQNLFIQTHESRHRVHLLTDGARRFSELSHVCIYPHCLSPETGGNEPVCLRKCMREYDGEDDFARSIDECYRAVRERKAAGGKGWPE
jgi:hypothetical protein